MGGAISWYVRTLARKPFDSKLPDFPKSRHIAVTSHTMRKQKSCAQLQSQHSDVTKRNSTTHVLSGSEATVSLCDVQMERSGTFAFTLTHSPRCFIVSVCFNGWLQYSERTNWRIDHAKYSKSHYIVQPKRKEKRIFFVFTFTIFCLHPIFVFNFNLNYSGVFFFCSVCCSRVSARKVCF